MSVSADDRTTLNLALHGRRPKGAPSSQVRGKGGGSLGCAEGVERAEVNKN